MSKIIANWITFRGLPYYTPIAYRKSFELKSKPQKATLFVTAVNRFIFYVNGEEVAIGPLRSYAKNKEYDIIDITDYLNEGTNHFACLTVYSNSCRCVGNDALIAQADIECEGASISVITDSTWVFRAANWHGVKNTLLNANGTEFQEHFDANLYPTAWQTEDYNRVELSDETTYLPAKWFKKTDCGEYTPVTVLGPVMTHPFVELSPRSVSPHTVNKFAAKCVWQGSDDRALREIDKNLAISFNESEKKGKKVELDNKSYSSKENNIFVFDFLKTRTIRPGIKINTLSGDVRIELYYSIQLDDAPVADRGFGNANEGFCDSFIPTASCKGFKAITSKGFRFLTVRIAGEGECEFELNSDTVDYTFGEMIKPKIDSEILSRCYDISGETIKSSTTDVYVDTCWRENALWTYDACVIGRAAYDTFGETKMWRRTMIEIANGITEDGVAMAMAIPKSELYLFDQTFIFVHYCLEFYKLTKDMDFAKQVFAPICRLLNYCERCVTEEDLFIPPMYSWHFVDWAKLDKRPYSLPINALYILACDAAAELANIVGDKNSSKKLEGQANRVRKAAESFYDEEKGAFLCHIEPEIEIGEYNKFSSSKADDTEAYKYNIYANCLSLRIKIGNKDMQGSTAKFMAEKLDNLDYAFCDFGAGGYDLLLAPLLEYGYRNEIIKYLENSMKHYTEQPFVTFGETRNGGIFNSAHGWGSAINTLINKLYK